MLSVSSETYFLWEQHNVIMTILFWGENNPESLIPRDLFITIYLNLGDEKLLRCEISATGSITSILCSKLKFCEILTEFKIRPTNPQI